MADDLQIKPATPLTNRPPTSGGTNPSAAAQTNQNIPGQVIDLRNIGQSSTQPANQTASATRTNTSPPSGTPAASADPSTDETYTSANGQTYTLPPNVREKFPDLMKLIKETESMNDEEREYWFQILPIMTEEQIKKFLDILVNEKNQLAKLDKEYETELTKLNEKHMIEWKAFESKEKRKALTDEEQKSKAAEQAQEEDLLKRLSQV